MKTLTGQTSTESHPFFKYYAKLSQQQNMLQDFIRTGAYHQAVMQNADSDFKDKIIVDVGTGSGILSFFAAQAGARKVYAIEASDVARSADKLSEWNRFDGVVNVIHAKVEDQILLEQYEDLSSKNVDLIISEPMGFMLLHERMLESFMDARDRFLKPNGRMFPSVGIMNFLPFCDYALHAEQISKADFWRQNNFYGVDVSALHEQAVLQNFSEAVVGDADISTSMSSSSDPALYTIDFEHDGIETLKLIEIPFEFKATRTDLIHGLMGWFDVDFIGGTRMVRLSTGPMTPRTHWYQCRFLLRTPIAVNVGQKVAGTIRFTANNQFSYDVELHMKLLGLPEGIIVASTNFIRLQDQQYPYSSNSSSSNMNMAMSQNGATYEPSWTKFDGHIGSNNTVAQLDTAEPVTQGIENV